MFSLRPLIHLNARWLSNFGGVVFVLMFSSLSHASLEAAFDNDCPEAPRTRVSKSAAKLKTQSSAIMETIIASPATANSDIPDFRPLWRSGYSCSKFIAGDNKLGSAGLQIAVLVNQQNTPNLMKGSADIQMICPSFSSWDDKKKTQFYVWAFASLAYQESSCGMNEDPHPGVSRGEKAQGLYQLSFAHETGKTCASDCSTGDAANDKSSSRCAVSMLECYSRTTKRFFWDDGYWQPLKATGEGVATCKRMAQFPGCNPSACSDAVIYSSRGGRTRVASDSPNN